MPGLKHERLCLPPVAGVDEAGRGPLAGPVVAAAVVLPERGTPRGIDDSKRLPAAERARLCARLTDCAVVGIGIVDPAEIDTLNIHWATMKAMTLAVDRLAAALGCVPGHVLVDGNRLPRWGYAASAIVGGDAVSRSIAAASIIAKHTRDTIMIEAAQAHPQYGWHSNKGYGSAAHLAALREHGPSPLHRRSFAPVAQLELVLGGVVPGA
ncbi:MULTISPECIES: ribonuclease HII [Sphingomonas]|uniref:Ribonuclease HII n=2 Tax=Sphingomonas adhaesiva TaxID=28212 RepID=A0A2A4I9P1_9SPHN|nr:MULTISPECIES: ribonuclease HII [Sphingomonas]PCG14502.1 ribonuclease HII [Sphingomonas adhaesiva]PZU80137.1 MAG: ribonuclease HII [Sphingomonas sp.]